MDNFPYADTIYYYNPHRHRKEDMAGTADDKGERESGEGRKKKRFISKAFIDSSDENDSEEERVQDTDKENRENRQSGGEESEEKMQNTAATTSESSSSGRSRHYLQSVFDSSSVVLAVPLHYHSELIGPHFLNRQCISIVATVYFSSALVVALSSLYIYLEVDIMLD